jgi:hypothetical protein
MKQAISRHFTERNEHFRDNPRRAGKKIWELDFFHDFDALRPETTRRTRRSRHSDPTEYFSA